MDSLIGFKGLLEIASKYGVVGLILLLWWYDNRQIRQQNEQHKDDLKLVLDRYQQDMAEQRKMYENNASLCRDFSTIASDLREIVVMNIAKMTEVDAAVKNNQFCPLVRVDKQKVMHLAQITQGNKED